jgi:F0F1-type ATP synthase assembly protein I
MSTRSDHGATSPGHAARASARRSTWTGVDHANIMSMELIGAILTWTGIGWLIDRWLGTPPWFLVIGALVGNFAGLYLIWLRAQRMEAADEREREALEAERRALRAAAKLPTEHRRESTLLQQEHRARRERPATPVPASEAATSTSASPTPAGPRLAGTDGGRP